MLNQYSNKKQAEKVVTHGFVGYNTCSMFHKTIANSKTSHQKAILNNSTYSSSNKAKNYMYICKLIYLRCCVWGL